ncbi:MAG: hypothetical protein FD155_1024 [Bacteroidetes bacterium]|nr:MAG: hypothetical protein FD155_1024 [Bacteroidota bacterium]
MMKQFIFVLGLTIILSKVTCGQNVQSFFFDEFAISANRSVNPGKAAEGLYGIGLGVYHSFRSDKKLNIITGIEYNRTSQFFESMYEGHFAHATDLIYTINCFSIPAGLRINFGTNLKVFIETGAFADLVFDSNRTGTMITYLPDDNNQMTYTEKEIDQKVKLSDSFGFYLGLGIRIPVSIIELIVKPDYKFGINELYSYQEAIFSRYFRLNIGLKIK